MLLNPYEVDKQLHNSLSIEEGSKPMQENSLSLKNSGFSGIKTR